MTRSFESLESRRMLSASLKHVRAKHPKLDGAFPIEHIASPHGGTSPYASSYTPSQIRAAYGFDQISIPGITADGAGQTVAIVDAYDNPNFVSTGSANFANSDLHKFDVAFGLQDPPSFLKVNQTGGTTMPATDAGWAGEIALDVEWVHAIAPKANMVLVEANSSSTLDLINRAANYARNRSEVSVVSMSFGLNEYSGETSVDTYFTTPTSHQGVTFLASTGDNGSPGGYPAYSPNVVAVGGTSLTMNRSTGAYTSESAWSGSGGGISTYISQPTYQNGIVTQTSTKRGAPDVAFLADPNTGVAVYDSINGGATAPWIQVGGTSLAAPMMAATVALANQARVANGMGTLNGRTETLPKIYSLAQSDFHDVTTGSNGGFSAGTGYDLVTGRGTPIANKFVPDLAGVATTIAAPSAPDLATASDSGASNTDNLTNVTAPTFTGTAVVGSTVALFAGSTQVGSTTADASGNYSVTSSALADGTYNFTVKATLVAASNTSGGLNVTIDATAPTATNPSFQYETAQTLSYTFSEALSTNPGAADLTLLNTTTGRTVSTTASYDAASRTVTYTFPDGILPNGNYQPTLSGAGIKDLAGNAMAANDSSINGSVGFFFLDGDANRDGVVNMLDFNIMASNFGTSAAKFSTGDFNYDHAVNAMDFAALSAIFGSSVSTANAAPAKDPAPAQATTASSLFSSTKVASDTIDVL